MVYRIYFERYEQTGPYSVSEQKPPPAQIAVVPAAQDSVPAFATMYVQNAAAAPPAHGLNTPAEMAALAQLETDSVAAPAHAIPTVEVQPKQLISPWKLCVLTPPVEPPGVIGVSLAESTFPAPSSVSP